MGVCQQPAAKSLAGTETCTSSPARLSTGGKIGNLGVCLVYNVMRGREERRREGKEGDGEGGIGRGKKAEGEEGS